MPDDATVLGEITLAEKVDLLSRAKAVLFPIDWDEPFGLVMTEAMACGTPVIATPRGSRPGGDRRRRDRLHRLRRGLPGAGRRGAPPARRDRPGACRAACRRLLEGGDGGRLRGRLPSASSGVGRGTSSSDRRLGPAQEPERRVLAGARAPARRASPPAAASNSPVASLVGSWLFVTSAPTNGMRTCPPCVWPVRIRFQPNAASSGAGSGECTTAIPTWSGSARVSRRRSASWMCGSCMPTTSSRVPSIGSEARRLSRSSQPSASSMRDQVAARGPRTRLALRPVRFMKYHA